MDIYVWRTKLWHFTFENANQKKKEMLDWCEKWKNKYEIKNVFVDNAWAVEYRLLNHQ